MDRDKLLYETKGSVAVSEPWSEVPQDSQGITNHGCKCRLQERRAHFTVTPQSQKLRTGMRLHSRSID